MQHEIIVLPGHMTISVPISSINEAILTQTSNAKPIYITFSVTKKNLRIITKGNPMIHPIAPTIRKLVIYN